MNGVDLEVLFILDSLVRCKPDKRLPDLNRTSIGLLSLGPQAGDVWLGEEICHVESDKKIIHSRRFVDRSEDARNRYNNTKDDHAK